LSSPSYFIISRERRVTGLGYGNALISSVLPLSLSLFAILLENSVRFITTADRVVPKTLSRSAYSSLPLCANGFPDIVNVRRLF
jgi:hypothetical protein